MGCSQPKLSRTGLRNILAFLKVELQHFLGGTRDLLRLPEGRRLTDINIQFVILHRYWVLCVHKINIYHHRHPHPCPFRPTDFPRCLIPYTGDQTASAKIRSVSLLLLRTIRTSTFPLAAAAGSAAGVLLLPRGYECVLASVL